MEYISIEKTELSWIIVYFDIRKYDHNCKQDISLARSSWTLVVLVLNTHACFASSYSPPWSLRSGLVVLWFASGPYHNWTQRRGQNMSKSLKTSWMLGSLCKINQHITCILQERNVSSLLGKRHLSVFFKGLPGSIAMWKSILQRFFWLQGENDRKKQLTLPYFESWPMTTWRFWMNAVNASSNESENCNISMSCLQQITYKIWTYYLKCIEHRHQIVLHIRIHIIFILIFANSCFFLGFVSRTRNLAYITAINKKITSYSDLDEVNLKTTTWGWHPTRLYVSGSINSHYFPMVGINSSTQVRRGLYTQF